MGADEVPFIQAGVPQYVVVSPDIYRTNAELFAGYRMYAPAGKYYLLIKK
jgi:hypothetical protein